MRWPFRAFVLAIAFVPSVLAAQASRFTFELPRTLVLIREHGQGGSVTRNVAEILRQSGFPLSEASQSNSRQCQLALAAMAGDETAAFELGRELNVELLILGTADWDTSLDDSTDRVHKRTAEIELRAVRLDAGRIVARARGRGSAADASVRAAEGRAVRYAVKHILKQSPFMVQITGHR